MSEKKEEKEEKATEGKTVDMKEKMEQASKEVEEIRKKERENCLEEIGTILKKYNCNLTARVIVGERGNIPQVFLIDVPQNAKG